MAQNVYELMFLLDTSKVAGDVQAAAKQLHVILEKHQSEILASRPWDERRLAFPIKNQKKGLYYLAYIRTESKNLRPIEQDLALNETVLRNLVMKIDPKMVDAMLAVARDEHALALQAVVEEPGEEGGRPDDDGRGPRRPRRDD